MQRTSLNNGRDAGALLSHSSNDSCKHFCTCNARVTPSESAVFAAHDAGSQI